MESSAIESKMFQCRRALLMSQALMTEVQSHRGVLQEFILPSLAVLHNEQKQQQNLRLSLNH